MIEDGDSPAEHAVYEAAHVPYNAFNDLQPMSGTVVAKDGVFSVALPAKSITFLTTDYEDREPAAVAGLRIAGGLLAWEPSEEADHRYYRVYKDGKQIASTVATSLSVPNLTPNDVQQFTVKSVDKWGNERK